MRKQRSFRQNIFFNLSGSLIPLVLSLLVIPAYLGRIGQSRYGIISLVWLLFGYFGLFDLGLSQATNNLLARPSNQLPSKQAQIFWTATVVNTVLGIIGALIFAVVGKLLLSNFVGIPINLRPELKAALPWVVCLLPLSTTGAVFVGALEAHERFLELNIVQIVGTSLGQLLPLAAVTFLAKDIETAVAATFLARLLTTIPIFLLAFRQCGRNAAPKITLSMAAELFRYGSWVTVSNIIGPILVSIDQLMIGAIAGVASVPQYSIPFNMATKILLIPTSMTRALFPQLTKMDVVDAKGRAEAITATVSIALTLVCAPLIILSHLAISLWLGRKFSADASMVARIILLGVWINGVAYVPYTLLQSQGRPSITAKLHLIELIPFFAVLWLGLHFFGLAGAAAAWSLRVLVDTSFLCIAAHFSSTTVKTLLPSLVILLTALGISVLAQENMATTISTASATAILITLYGIRTDAIFNAFYHKILRRLYRHHG